MLCSLLFIITVSVFTSPDDEPKWVETCNDKKMYILK
jgi:hypothetical protein